MRSPMSELLALGVSHRTAPLELRERLALPEGRAAGRRFANRPRDPLRDRLGELDQRSHHPANLMPALPLDEAGKYVAGAYVVFVALILAYVAIMAAKLERIEHELGELAELADHKSARASDGVAVDAAEPAAPLASKPAGNVAEGEASGGGVLDV